MIPDYGIEPLVGFLLAVACTHSQSLEAQVAAAQGLEDFVVVDNKAGRSDAAYGLNHVRLFQIVAANPLDEEGTKLLGKRMYCICRENEKENNIIVDDETGTKLFVLPVLSAIAERKKS